MVSYPGWSYHACLSSIPVNEGKVRVRVEGMDMEGVHVVVGLVVKTTSNDLHVTDFSDVVS